METAIFIAKILAVVYLSIFIGFLFNKKYYQNMFQKMFEDTEFFYFGGFLAIIFGFLLLHFHGEWTNDWTILITIIGWIAILKGIMLLAFPKITLLFKPLLKPENLWKMMLPFTFIFGLFFCYFGFFAS